MDAGAGVGDRNVPSEKERAVLESMSRSDFSGCVGADAGAVGNGDAVPSEKVIAVSESMSRLDFSGCVGASSAGSGVPKNDMLCISYI